MQKKRYVAYIQTKKFEDVHWLQNAYILRVVKSYDHGWSILCIEQHIQCYES